MYGKSDGGIKEMFVPNTPSKMVQELTAKDWYKSGYPRDTEDKDPTTGPIGPTARANTRSHNYEVFACSSDFPNDNTTLGGRKSRGTLLAGNVHIFRAAFQPDYWEIYTYKGTGGVAGDLLYYDPGSDSPALPADVIVTTGDNGPVRRCPGRGLQLCVWTPSTNTGAVSLVAKAVASLSTDVVGAIDE